MSELYRVYEWRSPEHKSYIGYTGLPMNKRSCGQNGWGYLQMEGTPIAEAVKKFSFENMEQNILRLCITKEEAQFYERYYILMKDTLYPNGYNTNFGTHPNIEKKEKVIKTGKPGWPAPPSGVPRTDEVKEKLRNISVSRNGQSVIQKDDDGNTVNIYSSISEAAESVDGDSEKIRLCLRGQRKHYRGYRWETNGIEVGVNNPVRILQYVNKNYEPVAEYGSLREAERETGVNRRLIRDCIDGKRERAGNYIWERA